MLAKVISAAVVGLDAVPVEVEIDIASQKSTRKRAPWGEMEWLLA